MLIENGFNIESFNNLETSQFSNIHFCKGNFICSTEQMVNPSYLNHYKSSYINTKLTIAYVKITSTEPYIQTIEIDLNIETLHKHKVGLIRLLEYYVTNKSFSYDFNLSNYNDYWHLTRCDYMSY
ncbi:hypothetical protein H374_6700 [Rickettsia prowazekii str. NMRC Madrid E]|nr:hypothetical protein H374_6700 [Rickettsia prowazekii str. NMRC Madrid E]